MREYKFRGYSKRTKSWVYGSLNTHDIHHGVSIVEAGTIIHDVYPESVGQYIGVKTPNLYGVDWDMMLKRVELELTELYEGDIVEAWSQGSKGTFTIVFHQKGNPRFQLYPAYHNGEHWKIHATNLNRSDCKEVVDTLVIIGTDFEKNILPKLIAEDAKI